MSISKRFVCIVLASIFSVSLLPPIQSAAVVNYQLSLSLSNDRSNPIPLQGETVSGKIYVFTSPDTEVATSSSNRVLFYLDDMEMTGSPVQAERLAPFDFAGGSVEVANSFDTNTIADGSHTITASLPLVGGSRTVVHATFTVAN